MTVQKNDRLDYIDSLRGIAILMVMLVHTSQIAKTSFVWLNNGIEFGQMGVILFFVLSGITQCASLKKNGVNSARILQFYIKRFFRIAPLYYVGILIYFSLTTIYIYLYPSVAGLHQQYTLTNILANVFFVHGFYAPANNNIVPGGWSIGTEMIFYVVAPFIFLWYTKIKNKYWFFVLPLSFFGFSYLFFYIGVAYFNFDISNNSFWYCNIINQLPVFFISISYYFFTQKITKGILKTKLLIGIFTLLMTLSIFLFIHYFSITIVPFICSLVFILLIEIFKRFDKLNMRMLILIGRASYSIYIFHFIFAYHFNKIILPYLQKIFSTNWCFIFCYCFTVSFSFIVATFSKKIIEQKGIEWGKKFYACSNIFLKKLGK